LDIRLRWRISKAPLADESNGVATALIQQMIGTWDVRQRMWLGAAANAINLPPAVAHAF
jgi:hypothetical protein